jgi:hypothetical protein
MTERWSMMAPHEAIAEALQYGAQQQQQQLLALHIQTNDRIDRQSYELQTRTSAVHKRYRDEVEREVGAMRARGIYDVSRQQILQQLVGRDALERAERAAPRQRQTAAARVASQQTRPTGARSDGQTAGRRPAPGSPEHDDMLADEYFRNGGRL